MARKKRRTSSIASTRITDEELIARLQDQAPDVLTANISELDFDAVVEGVLKESPSDENPHFYCRPCGEYHLKTHPHHAEMKRKQVARQTVKRAEKSARKI